jgi:hypothetical protein
VAAPAAPTWPKEAEVKYALLIYVDETGWDTAPEDQKRATLEKYESFAEDAAKRGMMRGGEQLHTPASATTVRVRNAETLVTDGPFAETKEQLGGFFLVECRDMDEAIELAAKIPGAQTGVIEVRPVVEGQDVPHDQ